MRRRAEWGVSSGPRWRVDYPVSSLDSLYALAFGVSVQYGTGIRSYTVPSPISREVRSSDCGKNFPVTEHPVSQTPSPSEELFDTDRGVQAIKVPDCSILNSFDLYSFGTVIVLPRSAVCGRP
jgi:hypothetical protein